MNFLPGSKIKYEELLYRAFFINDWKFDVNRPSSSIFKSSNSVSVDRDGNREDSEIINTFRERKNYSDCGLVNILAENCRKIEIEPSPDPDIENKNPYHALLHGIGRIGTTKGQARKLSKNCNLVIMAF